MKDILNFDHFIERVLSFDILKQESEVITEFKNFCVGSKFYDVLKPFYDWVKSSPDNFLTIVREICELRRKTRSVDFDYLKNRNSIMRKSFIDITNPAITGFMRLIIQEEQELQKQYNSEQKILLKARIFIEEVVTVYKQILSENLPYETIDDLIFSLGIPVPAPILHIRIIIVCLILAGLVFLLKGYILLRIFCAVVTLFLIIRTMQKEKFNDKFEKFKSTKAKSYNAKAKEICHEIKKCKTLCEIENIKHKIAIIKKLQNEIREGFENLLTGSKDESIVDEDEVNPSVKLPKSKKNTQSEFSVDEISLIIETEYPKSVHIAATEWFESQSLDLEGLIQLETYLVSIPIDENEINNIKIAFRQIFDKDIEIIK